MCQHNANTDYKIWSLNNEVKHERHKGGLEATLCSTPVHKHCKQFCRQTHKPLSIQPCHYGALSCVLLFLSCDMLLCLLSSPCPLPFCVSFVDETILLVTQSLPSCDSANELRVNNNGICWIFLLPKHQAALSVDNLNLRSWKHTSLPKRYLASCYSEAMCQP